QAVQNLAGQRRRIPEQRIKMGRGIKNVAMTPEGGAEPTEHIVSLEQQHLHSGLGQEVGAEQSANARADHDRIRLLGIRTAVDDVRVQPHARPPSRFHTCPVTYAASSPARYSASFA